MLKQLVDLHVHTCFSDGTLLPQDVVRYAQENGISAIAITDHDITDGIVPAILEGAKTGVEVIPGIELSAELKNSSEVEIHILGYYINWENSQFQEQLKLFRQVRERRAIHIVDKLAAVGIKINEDALFRAAGVGSIGRLHIARVMLEQKAVNSIHEAFQKFLGWGRPAFVPKLRLKPEQAIKMIKRIGGIPVLAHPFYGNYNNKNLIGSLVRQGLAGIEAWHSKHPTKIRESFIKLAAEFDLVATGGSDFHGSTDNGDASIGGQKVPYESLLSLKKIKTEIDKNNRHILRSHTPQEIKEPIQKSAV